jgi:hypothetical protein
MKAANHRKKIAMNRTKSLASKLGFVLGAALLGMLSGHSTYAEVSVEVGVAIHAESDFYEPLTPLGDWVVVGSYGRCWRPARMEADWRPYSNGSWEYTDDGWYWASDEPWGWATYHYGRWDMNAQFGWFWVPQTVWAPAWVSWHEGGGYIGWAPLSPSGSIDVRVMSPRIVFVEQRHFLEPVRRTTVVVNNTTIINKTVVNKGPQTTVIEKVTGHKIQPVQVRELRHKEEAVVAGKQRATAPASEKNEKQVQPPVRTEAEPIDKKAAPARELRQAEKPVVTPTVPESPAPKKAVHDLDAQKPATQQVRPDEESRARQEAKPEPKREVKPEAAQPSKPEGEKHGQKEDKTDKESEKQGEGQPTHDQH